MTICSSNNSSSSYTHLTIFRLILLLLRISLIILLLRLSHLHAGRNTCFTKCTLITGSIDRMQSSAHHDGSAFSRHPQHPKLIARHFLKNIVASDGFKGCTFSIALSTADCQGSTLVARAPSSSSKRLLVLPLTLPTVHGYGSNTSLPLLQLQHTKRNTTRRGLFFYRH